MWVWVGGCGVGGDTGGPRGGEPGVPGVRGHDRDPPDRIRTHPPRLTTPPRLSPLFRGGVGGCGCGWVTGGWRGVQRFPAVVSRGSRASRVTFRTPPTGSAPTHLGSPPITTDHHCFVGMWWVGKCGCGWGVEGCTGGPRGGEPRVPDVRSHVQDPFDGIHTHMRRLTTPPRLSPLFGVRVGGCGWGGVGGWEGDSGGPRGGEPGVPDVRGHVQDPPAPTRVGSPPPRDYHHCFVGGWAGVGVGGWVGGAGGHRGSPRW